MNEDWEPKRIQRPKGVPEWGVPPTERQASLVAGVEQEVDLSVTLQEKER